ncbi:hypothetical protein [Kordia sp.]|uniref:hypothetical protein n=1 Tax=Kordia sp. TaxID=1965332 RepID=UPI003D26DC60
MKLTATHIAELYKFTREHYVEYYDLQTELVDHLANGIEKRWEHNPQLSFDDALNLEFKEFGIFGFNDIIEKYSESMSKRYIKFIFRFMREYIKLPKIIGTLCAILALFCMIRYSAVSTWIAGILFIMVCFSFFFQVYNNDSSYKKRRIETGKRWKLEEMIHKTGHSGFYVLNFYHLIHFSDIIKTDYIVMQLLIAIFLVFISLFTYISTNVLPQKAEELLRETYPEYELVD